MSHLYWIKDKQGNKIRFKPNWAQEELMECKHPCQVTLKARQLGITTFYCIKLLDSVLWEDFCQAGIIAHTLTDSQSLFVDKLKFTFDHLHPDLRTLFRTVGDSAKELRFSHGSSIRVGTSLRSSTLNYLHISELGKICAKYPEKAREVVSGALQTIAPGQRCYIESTAEGSEGFYHDLCVESERQQKAGATLGPLDYNFFFFPWWRESEYTLSFNELPQFDTGLVKYFDKLSGLGIELTTGQKLWYSKKKALLYEDMTREYPSYPHEAFAASQVGNWYATQMKELYESGHVTEVSYDKSRPVFTASDIGQDDPTAIWFFQFSLSGEIRVIDYFERSDCPLNELAHILNSKGYTYEEHIWPHDARARDKAGITFEMQLSEFNLSGIVLERHGLLDGINLVRTTLPRMWFDGIKCKDGLKALSKYKKKWNNQIGGYTSEAVHDDASDGADAMRYLVAGLSLVSNRGDLKTDVKVINAYMGNY